MTVAGGPAGRAGPKGAAGEVGPAGEAGVASEMGPADEVRAMGENGPACESGLTGAPASLAEGGGRPADRTQASEAGGVVALAAAAVAVVWAGAHDADPSAGLQGGTATLVGYLGVAAVTPVLVRIDVTERRLPNALVGVAAVAWGVSTVLIVLAGGPAAAATSVVSATAVVVVGLVAAVAGGLGMGDVKLGAVLTGLASAAGPTALLGLWGLAGTLAVALAVASAGVRVVRSRSRRPSSPEALTPPPRGIPFGPCLLAAFWCVVLGPGAAVALAAASMVR